MIEELRQTTVYEYDYRGRCVGEAGMALPTGRDMMNKINELVQHVNVLEKALAVTIESCFIPLDDRFKIHKILDDARLHIEDGDIIENK